MLLSERIRKVEKKRKNNFEGRMKTLLPLAGNGVVIESPKIV